MKERQAAEVEAFHQHEATRPLTVAREASLDAPANAPQVGVVEMDGGRIRTREENSPRGITHPHWREFQAGCVVRLQSEESVEDPRPEVPKLFLNRPKVQKLVSQLHRQRTACSGEDTDSDPIGELLAAEQRIPSSRWAKKGRNDRKIRCRRLDRRSLTFLATQGASRELRPR